MRRYVPFGEGGDMTAFRGPLATYFRSKREQLLVAAREAETPHAGLLGGFRERLVENFLTPLLPRRFSTGRGIIYGMAHVSRECDVVVWDSDNYFSIPFLSYSHYFAESVRLVLEAKTTFSRRDLDDVREKTKAVRDIVPNINM